MSDTDTTIETPTLQTRQELADKLSTVKKLIDKLEFVNEYTIESYPIGGTNRGLCRMEVERNNRGSRTVRTTTNKRGAWCKPKKSTYRDGYLFVVDEKDLSAEEAEELFPGPAASAWLDFSPSGVFLQYANGDGHTIYKYPNPMYPSRTVKKSIFVGGDDTPADPPEVCDLWDDYKSWLLEMYRYFNARVEELQESNS